MHLMSFDMYAGCSNESSKTHLWKAAHTKKVLRIAKAL